MMSLHQFQAQQQPDNQGFDDEYEDYLPDDCSEGEGSWETHHSAQDSQGNVTVEDVAEANVPATQALSKPNFIPKAKLSSSNPNSPMLDIGPNMRIVPGASRRPISIDAKENKRASRARIEEEELDYAAYI
jgi:axial budding pattern protein 2